jgi:hypothetical protein
MPVWKSVLALLLGIAVMLPVRSVFGLCNAENEPGVCGEKDLRADKLLCGRYSLSFSAAIVPSGHIAGSGVITSNCRGRLIKGTETINDEGEVCQGTLTGTYSLDMNGTGTVSFSLVPPNPTYSCPIVNFSEAIAVGGNGSVVKAVNTGSDEVTIQEEWVRQ